MSFILSHLQGTFASKIEFEQDNAEAVMITREVDGGLETLSLNLPAVVTCDLRLNEPRFTSLSNTMKAKKKKIETIEISSLGVDIEPRIQILGITEPPKRARGILVDDVDHLVDKLRTEANVL